MLSASISQGGNLKWEQTGKKRNRKGFGEGEGKLGKKKLRDCQHRRGQATDSGPGEKGRRPIQKEGASTHEFLPNGK